MNIYDGMTTTYMNGGRRETPIFTMFPMLCYYLFMLCVYHLVTVMFTIFVYISIV